MGKKTTGSNSKTQSISERLAAQEQSQQVALVSEALRKLRDKEPLTGRERKAVRDYDRTQLDTWGHRFVSNVPKREYCDQLGIQQKVALEQSRRFNLPYHRSGKTIDLFQQLSAWHVWASKNKALVTRTIRAQRHDKEDGFDDEDYEHWDTRRVKAVALLKEHDYEERQGRMQPIELVHELLNEFYALPMLRRIEGLEKRGTPLCDEIADQLRQDVKDFEAAVESVFENEDNLSQTESKDSTVATGSAK